MLNAFIAKSQRCCKQAHERLVRQLGACEMTSNNSAERHDCYRQAAKASGARSKACMAQGNL